MTWDGQGRARLVLVASASDGRRLTNGQERRSWQERLPIPCSGRGFFWRDRGRRKGIDAPQACGLLSCARGRSSKPLKTPSR